MRFDKNDELATNAIRMLGVDSIEKANSGHPGIVLDAAPMAYVLWNYYLNVNPSDSKWINRDRFVLSAGHGSAMLYALLHLSGYQVSLDDLKHFRTLGSKTPGHPEFGWTDGVDATTGPLGQGIGMSVGMAMAEKRFGAKFNRDGFPVIDHYTYAIAGDGDLMEGISHEAASLAGHFNLNKLIVLYDSNDISLDGPLANSFDENVEERFKAYGWNYEKVEDGNNLTQVSYAIQQAKRNQHGPTIIEVKNVIGYGAPNENSNSVRGAALSSEAITQTRQNLNWPYDPFIVPEVVLKKFNNHIRRRGTELQKSWQELYRQYEMTYPELAAELVADFANELPDGFEEKVDAVADTESEATRVSSSRVLQAVSSAVPSLWGGSADLSSSNKTFLVEQQQFSADNPLGRNIPFGVREFAEGTIMNGIALHGGSRVFGSTFLVFADYMKPAIRLAAMQHLPVTYVFTHDSIAVGEDGPTHEPIEQLENLRSIPGLTVIRPADLDETKVAWQYAMAHVGGPTALILSRQALPKISKVYANNENLLSGYTASPAQTSAELTILTTGSEVSLGIELQRNLLKDDIDAKVVSIPSLELFEQLSDLDKKNLIGNDAYKRMAIEFGLPNYWYQYVANDQLIFGMREYGASGDANDVIKSFGLTTDKLAEKVASILQTSVSIK